MLQDYMDETRVKKARLFKDGKDESSFNSNILLKETDTSR